MFNYTINLIPACFAILIALITKRVIAGLATGVVTAAFIASHYSLKETLYLIVTRIGTETNIINLFTQAGSYEKLYMFGFLITLGVLIQLITHSGGISAYTRFIAQHLKSKRSLETTSLVLSCLFFIDDYLNSLMVGAIMRPLTDKFLIPRIKLAFLINAMSSPLCVLIPATSWVAMILMQLEISGVTISTSPTTLIAEDPFKMYMQTLPFLFYPLLIVFSALMVVRFQLGFGTMLKQEQLAQKTGQLFGGKVPLNNSAPTAAPGDGSLLDFFIPIITFIVIFIGALLYSGNFFLFNNGDRTFLSALQHGNSFAALFIAGISSLLFSSAFGIFTKRILPSQLPSLFYSGFILMHNSILMLILAWTLGSLLKDDLCTGQIVASLLSDTLNLYLLPCIFFIIATILSASIGSAWGSIIFLLPLALPMITRLAQLSLPLLPEQAGWLVVPTLGAILSGAIAGGHFSPIADATIFASTSSGCYHLDHVKTQISYSLPAFIGAIISFITVGILAQNRIIATPLWSLVIGCICTGGILFTNNRLSHRKQKRLESLHRN
jgi:tetracycline resistance efflux pump